MNKKIIIIFLILLFFVNLFSVRSFYYNFIGNKYFIKNDFDSANKAFEKSGNQEGIYNEGNVFYKNSDFSGAINNYELLLNTRSKDLLFSSNHNLGNSYYRIGENSENKIQNYEKAVTFYQNALNIKEDNETRLNLEFVLKKLEEEKKKQEDKESEDKEKNNKNEDGGNESDKGNSEEQSNEGNEENSSNEEVNSKNNSRETTNEDNNTSNKTGSGTSATTGSGGQNADNSGENKQNNNSDSLNNKLTQDQLQAIQNYKENLLKEQDYNSDGFNKVYEGNGNFDLFDGLFNNSLLDQDDKKDW